MKTSRKFVSIERLRIVAANALNGGYGEIVAITDQFGGPIRGSNGHPLHAQAVRMEVHMGCEKPYPFELVARYSARHLGPVDRPSHTAGILAVFGTAACRKCKICMANRSRFWGGRAFDEYQASPRTIMGTFTTSPEKDQEFDWRLQVGEQGVRPPMDLEAMTEVERFTARAAIFGDEITKWIKSIRKGQESQLAGGHWKPRVRYLLIAEAHDSENTSSLKKGRPHFHMLLHEQQAGALIGGDTATAFAKGRSYEWERWYRKTKHGFRPALRAHNDAWIKQLWPHGHTSFDLCETANDAVYVCKYLSDAMQVRVRASHCYGEPGETNSVNLFPPSGTK